MLLLFSGQYMRLLVEDYHLIVEKRFACPNDPENYAGGSVSSWQGH
jgi:hypothetical protein